MIAEIEKSKTAKARLRIVGETPALLPEANWATITAFLGHYKIWSEVNWATPIAMAISAVIVAQLASGKSAGVSPTILKRAFAVLLFTISIITLLNAWVF